MDASESVAPAQRALEVRRDQGQTPTATIVRLG
jgi:hypothetical protein